MTTRAELPPLETDLGAQEAVFGSSRRNQVARLFFGLICCGLGVVMLVALILRLHEGQLEKVSGGLLGIGICGVSGVALLRGIRTGNRTRVEVYEQGLVLRDEEDDTSCRWTEILAVTEKKQGLSDPADFLVGVMSNETHAFHLQPRSGPVIVLKNYISE